MMTAPAILAGQTRRAAYAGRPLARVLEELRAAGLRLVYSSDLVGPDLRVESEPRAVAPRDILDELLAPHGLQALEGPGGTLLIVRRTASAEARGGIAGSVRVRADRRPLAGAIVFIDGTDRHAATDPDGRFEIRGVRPGTHTLKVRVPGLREERFEGIAVASGATAEVELDLVVLPEIREEVVVKPDADRRPGRRGVVGEILSAREIGRLPTIGSDLNRTITLLPGVAAGDRSASLSVRGGNWDELLVVLDGLELYEPFHLKQLQRFSGIVDATTIGRAELLTGTFPVEYGDRMSGVLDLASAVPDGTGHASITTNFINSRLFTDGTFGRGAGHWLVSARRWYPDEVVSTLDPGDDEFEPSYYDLFGKVQMPLGDGTILTGNVLATQDEISFEDRAGEEDVRAGSRDRYAWLNLKSLWSPRLYYRALLFGGRIESDRRGIVDRAPEVTGRVSDDRSFSFFGLKQYWTYETSGRNLFEWGLGARRLEADYRYSMHSEGAGPAPAGGGDPLILDRREVLHPSGFQLGAYVAQQFRPFSRVTADLGLRWDRQTYTGEDQISPRANLVVALGEGSALRAGWGRFYQSQGVHELQVEDGVTDFSPAELAEQWILSFEHVSSRAWRLRVDAYRKEMSHPRPRYENLFNPYELFPELEADRVRVTPSRAEAKGIDFSFNMDRGRGLAWRASYSLASVADEIDGEMVPRSWDQRHALNFNLHYGWGDGWAVSLAGIYHSGWPTTPVFVRAVDSPDGSRSYEAVLGRRNAARFPAYHRLDFKASRHVRLGKAGVTLFLEVTNLYNRKNVCCVEDLEVTAQPDGTARIDRTEGFWLRRVPSLGVTWTFKY